MLKKTVAFPPRSVARPPRSVARATWLAAIALTTTGFVCGGGGDPPPPPREQSAAVNAQYQYSSGGGPRCTGNLTWLYEPVAVGASGLGSTDPVTNQQSYDVPSSGALCALSDSAQNLRPGRWRVSVSAGATCELELRGGFNNVTLGQGAAC